MSWSQVPPWNWRCVKNWGSTRDMRSSSTPKTEVSLIDPVEKLEIIPAHGLTLTQRSGTPWPPLERPVPHEAGGCLAEGPGTRRHTQAAP